MEYNERLEETGTAGVLERIGGVREGVRQRERQQRGVWDLLLYRSNIVIQRLNTVKCKLHKQYTVI